MSEYKVDKETKKVVKEDGLSAQQAKKLEKFECDQEVAREEECEEQA